MNNEETGILVDSMYRLYPVVEGWTYHYQYPGYFEFSKGDISFCFTPDWDKQGEVCIQVFSEKLGYVDGWDIPYSGTLTADYLISLIYEKLVYCNKYV